MYLEFIVASGIFALVAGMFLLAKSKKEALGAFFSFISWFVIAMGIGLILCGITRAFLANCSHKSSFWGKNHFYKQSCMPHCCMMQAGKMACCMHLSGKCFYDDKFYCDSMEDLCNHKMKKMKLMDNFSDLTPVQKADSRVKSLTELLDLSQQQIPKVRQILLTSFTEKHKIISENSHDKQKCDILIEKNKELKLQEMKKILTPEQFIKYEKSCNKPCRK